MTAGQEKVRCEYCDGTGDVHRADGEWLGSCDCTVTPPDTAALLEKAEKALGPFSDWVKESDARSIKAGFAPGYDEYAPSGQPFTMGQLRAARSALSDIRKARS